MTISHFWLTSWVTVLSLKNSHITTANRYWYFFILPTMLWTNSERRMSCFTQQNHFQLLLPWSWFGFNSFKLIRNSNVFRYLWITFFPLLHSTIFHDKILLVTHKPRSTLKLYVTFNTINSLDWIKFKLKYYFWKVKQ